VGYLTGLVLLFSVGFNFPLITVFPAWVMLLSIYMVITVPMLKEEAPEQPEAPEQ
jgi:hypothetical protein